MGERAATERHLGGALRLAFLMATDGGDRIDLAQTTMTMHGGDDNGFAHYRGSATADGGYPEGALPGTWRHRSDVAAR
jgi:archaellin